MSDEPPTPPAELPADIVESLNECSPELLHHVGTYVTELAAYREREDSIAEECNEDSNQEASSDRPDEVPSKATITIKKINDNRYYYWQWREADKVRSQYKGPVDPEE